MKTVVRTLVALAAISSFACVAQAGLILFDFTTNGGTNAAPNSAGDAFDGLNGASYTQGGVTITLSTSSGNGPSEFNAISGRSGVNTDGSGDASSSIDSFEQITIEFSFVGPDLTLTEIDFTGLGDNLSDSASVEVGGMNFTLHTGVADVGGGDQDWEPSATINIGSGDSIAIGANVPMNETASLGLIGVLVTAVPEPTSALLGGVFLLLVSGRRRR